MYKHLEVVEVDDIDIIIRKLKQFIIDNEFESDSVGDDISLDHGNILKHIQNIQIIQEMAEFMEAAKSMFIYNKIYLLIIYSLFIYLIFSHFILNERRSQILLLGKI